MGASWGADGTIIFSQNEARVISRISEDGGTAERVTDLPGNRVWWPQILPGGRSILATRHADPFSIIVLSLETGLQEVLIPRASGARYVPSGHLVYSGEGGVMGPALRRCTARTHRPGGARREAYGGISQLSVSDTGVLAYISGPDLDLTTPVWVSRYGTEEVIPVQPSRYRAMDISHDGGLLAIQVLGTSSGIRIYDFTPGTEPRPLTVADGDHLVPMWAADGRRVAYVSHEYGEGGQLNSTISWQSVDGGPAQLMVGPREGDLWLEDWSRDGVLVFDAFDPETGENADVWFLAPESSEPKLFLGNPWDEWGGRRSPDGRWIAYSSDESGESEIYVADFPEHTTRLQISTNPGLGKEPAWSASGDEIYFSGGGRFCSVRVRTEGGLSADPPEFLFEGPYAAAMTSTWLPTAASFC